jgi:archaellum component FlaC
MMTKRLFTVSGLSAALVAFLAVSAFVLSYAALQATAASHGIGDKLSHLFPLIVDGFILVASLTVLRRSLSGESTKYPWVLVAAFSALSVFFNVSHAPANNLARVIASVPPLALLLSFELLMSQVRSDMERRGVSQSLDGLSQRVAAVTSELSRLDAKKDALTKTVDDLSVKAAILNDDIGDRETTLASLESDIAAAEKTRQKALTSVKALAPISDTGDTTSDIVEAEAVTDVTDRRALVLTMVNSGATPDDIAAALEVSKRTIQRDIKALNGQVKNGNQH